MAGELTDGGITLRPYQALCTICSLGAEDSEQPCPSVREILAKVRAFPDIPITLRCNVGDVFVYQDPGPEGDSPEGAAFNMKRDLEILQRLNLAPGTTLPARIVFNRMMDRIHTVSDICGFETVTSEAWQGCPRAGSGRYERGLEKGITAIVPPRCEDEMKRDKESSLRAMYRADAKKVRPHILICAVCQYGGGLRPPFPEDNLPELVQLMFEDPDTVIELARGADWMMCAPCPTLSTELGACVNVKGSGGLTNQLRDLRTLQLLGLSYGSRMRAWDLYDLLFERIPSTLLTCRFDNPDPSVWYDGCAARTTNSENYEKGREMLALERAARLGS